MNKRGTLLAIFLVGCGTPNRLDVGDESTTVGAELASYVAQWDGYAESYTFAGDQEDRVRITLNADGTGTFRGGLEELFGSATDANGLYPPTYGDTYPNEAWSLREFRSGYDYVIQDVSVSDERLRFSIDTNQIMDSWCALQPLTEDGWTCSMFGGGATLFEERDEDGELQCYLLNDDSTSSGSSDAVDDRTPVNCVVTHQCNACVCGEDGCSAPEGNVIEVDAALDDNGESLEGTMFFSGDETRVTLRLKRKS